jgi:hypothetical protein
MHPLGLFSSPRAKMIRGQRGPFTAAALVWLVLPIPFAWAGQDVWTNLAGNGLWTSGGNWSTGSPPQTGDDVVNILNVPITLNIYSGINSLNTAGAFTVESEIFGTQPNAASPMNIAGQLTLLSGGEIGSANVTASGGVNVFTSGNVDLLGGTLTNAGGGTGTLNISGSAFLGMDNAATFVNDGTLTAAKGEILALSGGYIIPPALTNSGTFDVNDPAGTFIVSGVTFNNSGLLEVQAGTLALEGGGAGTGGQYLADTGATLNFASGTFTFDSASSLGGAGTVEFTGGTASFSGTSSGNGAMLVSGGKVAFNGSTTVLSLTMSSGAVYGTGILTSAGLFTCSGGILQVYDLTADSGIDFQGAGTAFWQGGTLTNSFGSAATIGSSGSFNLDIGFDSTFVNAGTLTATGGQIVFNGTLGLGPATVSNTGTFDVDVPGATFAIGSSVMLNNNATVEVQSGTLAVQGGGMGNGIFRIDSGAILAISANTTTSEFTGDGHLIISGGKTSLVAGAEPSQVATLTLTGNGTLDIANNTLMVNYGLAADPVSAIRGYLISGFNAGGAKWAGTGIVSSLAAANPSSFSVGYADGGNPVDVANTGVPAGEVEVKFTVAGDANLSGEVDLSDLVIVASDFGMTGADWAEGDVNYDGNIDLSDLVIVASDFGASLSSVSTSDFSGSFVVEWQLALAEVHGSDVQTPEPVGLAMIAASGLLLGRKRR